MPGLINTHTHAPMVLYRGLADDLALMDWLQKYIFPAEAKTVTPEFVRAGTRLAALEMIHSGTTTYADMYYFEEEIARVTKAAGLRGVLGQTIIQFPVADAKTPAEGLSRDRTLHPGVRRRRADRAGGRAARDVHARRGDAEGSARPLADRERVAGDHPSRRNPGRGRRSRRSSTRPRRSQYLESLGFWGPRTLAAHGVHVTPDDIRHPETRGVGVSHNPESNMKLASGTAPVPAMRRAGVPVGLGTDGAASNNDLDMFEAMRQAALLHKLQSNDPRTLPARRRARRWRPSTARAALGMDADDRLARARQARRPDHRLDERRRGRRRCTIPSRTSSTSRAATTCGRRS